MSQLHFHSRSNWINDPNGFIFYNGEYHLFFQHFPYGKRWGTMHWGHATSKDLIHWNEHAMALHPSVRDDQNGCFSGSAIVKDGQLELVYTGVRYITPNPKDIHTVINDDFLSAQLKISSPDGYYFDNQNGKKTILPVSEDLQTAHPIHTRDPKVWKTEDGYTMVVGTSIPAGAPSVHPEVSHPHAAGQKGALNFYTSPDLETWVLKNTFTLENDALGWMWECPDLVNVGLEGKRVLLFSPMNFWKKPYNPSQAMTAVVDFEESACHMDMPLDPVPFDWGLELYAPQSTVDENGNPVVIAWLRMPEVHEEKWIGLYSFPRTVRVDETRQNVQFPVHPNVKKLFSKPGTKKSLGECAAFRIQAILPANSTITLAGLKIDYDGQRVQTDRSALISKHTTLPAIASAPMRGKQVAVDFYGDGHIFELYLNDGEKVISQFVDGFTQELEDEQALSPIKLWLPEESAL